MKKILLYVLGASLAFLLLSCEKEEATANCNCGNDVDRGTSWADVHQLRIAYYIDYKNDCSGNIKTRRETRYTGTGVPDWWGEDIYCDTPW